MQKNIDWDKTYAAIYRAKKEYLKPVTKIEDVGFEDLIGIEEQKTALIKNTERFLDNLPSNNVLLWGARGTGKSSLIKAVLNTYAKRGLRLIEIDRDDLDDLIEISDVIRDLPYKFIIFCDDLSFEEGEKGYKGLKRTLEGSIEAPPENVKIYATSNRRHLITEYQRDNEGTKVGNNGEIHYSDSVEEKISLSDRFGLWLSFYHGDQDEYLAVVDSYFKDYKGDRKLLHVEALRFAQSRASKSARTAKQFYNSYFKR
ncbi:MAG: ATP-binding protein [Sulfurimonas sp.]|uniref:ATP-binding protein n=1 Tax=Sulfurimonas sp. TaxID=2022749 RepID=UPI002629AD80|nr:ATP-binding protein [Sulfurimonas sp.]MDD3475414.1 ATP-binding protein [Sulfurimonas sp.]HUH41870.1 ATP-binding protein [Sulfurimonas sp.]